MDEAEAERKRIEWEAEDALEKKRLEMEEQEREERLRRRNEEEDWEAAERMERELRERNEWPAKLRGLRYDLLHTNDFDKRVEIGRKIDDGNKCVP